MPETLASVSEAAKQIPVMRATGRPAQGESRQGIFVAYDAQARELLGRMTLDEKIGQMIQPDQAFLKKPSDVEEFFLGSLLSGGGSGPQDRLDYNLAGWTNMVDAFQKRAMSTRLGIPLLYGIDAVHGHNKVPNATLFPHNIGLGCANHPALLEKISRITAEEVRATGIHWAFGPCVTVPQDQRWGRTYEGYSENPALVRELGAAAVRGLQGEDLSYPLSILACAKHFIGDGGTTFASAVLKDSLLDQGDTRIDEATLRRIHLPGYIDAVREGVATVMVSYSSWNGVRCSADRRLLTDLLKNELGFEGFVVSDYNAVDQITPDYKTAIGISVNAGMDMVMMTDKYPDFFGFLKELVIEGAVPMSRIDDAVTRILRVKFAMGLMDASRDRLADRNLWKSFGSPAHRQIARQAVRESVVLLKNQGNLLPLSKTVSRIVVAGRGADDLGMQCGGWTIDWQSKLGQHVPGATSILAAIGGVVSKETRVIHSADGTGAAGADVGVVVIGEGPYAEFKGDRTDLTLDEQDVQAVANLKKAGIPFVVILLSGRPIILGEVADQADALLAAWLPGSEGEGMTDILFGDFKPTGKLSFTWPRSMSQLPINIHGGHAHGEPLFKFGHGLTYGE
jgi:beta-glucosidase